MRKFKVGDKVRITNPRLHPANEGYVFGTVATISVTTGVGIDVYGFTGGHDLDLPHLDHSGWWVGEGDLELVAEEDKVAYETNGDVVMAEGTGEVFLYAGGMYYNLSSPTEMRGRKNLRRAKGPVTKITTLVGSGEVFKNAAKRAS